MIRHVFPAQLASIPSPSSGTISIGPIALNAYGLMIALGVIAGVWLLGRQLEASHLGTRDDASSMGLWGVLGGVIGARAYHVVTDWSRFSDDLVSIPKIWQGGLGIPGGLVVGILVGAWQAKRRGVRPAVALTFAMPAIALAQSIGRWGNWFNQELYGAPTTLPWGLKLNMEGTAIGHSEQCYDGATCPSGTLFHPTFLYEMIWNLIGAAIIVYIGSKAMKKLKAGSLFAVYIMWYTLGRTWIESLRIDYAHEFLGVRINVWVSMAVFVLGAVSFIVVQQMGKDTDLLAEKLRTVTEIEQRLENGESEDSSDSVVSFPEQTVDEIKTNDAETVSNTDKQPGIK